MSRLSRLTVSTVAVSVLSLTASGCVTVHGEREVVPTATKAEAARALKDFTAAYNAADKAYDPALDADQVTGPLSAINQAGLRAKQKNNPDGNAQHVPLELTDATFSIPAKAGWPRWFIADTDSNRDRDDDPSLDTRWFVAFTRGGPDQAWEAAYLSILTPDEIPELAKDKNGRARPVAPDGGGLAVSPGRLSAAYASYLQDGEGELFADGQHTSDWRLARRKNAKGPGRQTQYIDQEMTKGPNAPMALRTKDGGALVLFATRHFEKWTAAPGVPLNPDADVKALMKGEAKESVTLERVSNQAVLVPAKGATDSKVEFLNRIQGLTGAKGS